jgi:hypothetical protein
MRGGCDAPGGLVTIGPGAGKAPGGMIALGGTTTSPPTAGMAPSHSQGAAVVREVKRKRLNQPPL